MSARQWGTVREDLSADGEAWSYLTHDQARSRAYRWGEDGIAGVSDDRQQIAREISDRLTRTFLRGPDGRRPLYGGQRPFQEDPHWRDLLIFPEYVHGDNGAALGASHQTGWTGLAAVLPHLFAVLRPEHVEAGSLWPHTPAPTA